MNLRQPLRRGDLVKGGLVVVHCEPPGFAGRRPLPIRDHCFALAASAFPTGGSRRAPGAGCHSGPTEICGRQNVSPADKREEP